VSPTRRGRGVAPARRKKLPAAITTLIERLTPLGAVAARPMFGGHGLYLDGLMFGLVWQDSVYFKVDDHNRGRFEAAGMSAFRPYEERDIVFSYFEVPARVLADGETARGWAAEAHQAARRATAAKSKRRASRARF
jgi:DNA transformation protein